jgi:type IV secretory pathway TrbF-like protein
MNLAEAQIPAPGRATANVAEGAQSKPEPRNPHRVPETSPYLAARREWDERYGNLITRAKNWRIAAFLALLIATLESAV